MKKLTTVPAHFDGKEIKFDVPVMLAPNTHLLVTIKLLKVNNDRWCTQR